MTTQHTGFTRKFLQSSGVRVWLSATDRTWHVTYDGEEVSKGFATSTDAWAYVRAHIEEELQ